MNNPIYPCLWFDGKAKEAALLYCSLFGPSAITSESPLVVTFELSGQKFMCLNGGPYFTINPSVSFYAVLETEAEVDHAWQTLLEGGSVLMPLDRYDWSAKYGWLQDRFGVNWQLSLGKTEEIGQKFTPTLMFTGDQNGRAETAIRFYTSVFEASSVAGILRYAPGDNDVAGNIKHAQFRLGEQLFMAMDSSLPHPFSFNEAVSFVVECETQSEIDYYWEKLSAHPDAEQCGWLKDPFGLSWQIVPAILSRLMNEPGKAERVTAALLKMKKLNIEALKNA